MAGRRGGAGLGSYLIGLDRRYINWAQRRLKTIMFEYVHGSPEGRRVMAELSRVLNHPCGSLPDVAAYCLNDMPPMPGRARNGDQTIRERASWYAFGLFGVHQKGVHEKLLHRDYYRVNEALDDLVKLDASAERKARAIACAKDMDDAVHRLRDVMPLMRQYRIPLDHALLAVDLMRLEDPMRAALTRADWGRFPVPGRRVGSLSA